MEIKNNRGDKFIGKGDS